MHTMSKATKGTIEGEHAMLDLRCAVYNLQWFTFCQWAREAALDECARLQEARA